MLIPFPGPGWAIVILGLAIWAIEFAWARNLLEFTKRHVQSWTHWIGRQSLPMRVLIGLVGLIFVSAIVWASVKLTFGIGPGADHLELAVRELTPGSRAAAAGPVESDPVAGD